jgi:hypothetical protein
VIFQVQNALINSCQSIKCLTEFEVSLSVNGWYWAHLENEKVFQKKKKCWEDGLFSLSFWAGSRHRMMLDMAQLQGKQPFLGHSVAVYEYTTSALYTLRAC